MLIFVYKSTYLSSFYELFSGSLLILFVSPPGPERRGLQGSAKGEGQDPRFRQRTVVDSIEMDGSLLFTLTTGEKSHSCREQIVTLLFSLFALLGKIVFSLRLPWDCWRYSAANGGQSGHSNLLWAVLGGATVSRSDHIGLKESALKVDMVV